MRAGDESQDGREDGSGNYHFEDSDSFDVTTTISYASAGVYNVRGALSHTGTYTATVLLHMEHGGKEPLPGTVTVESICPDLKEPLPAQPGKCGCEAGTEADTAGICQPCVIGFYWDRQTRRCTKCPLSDTQTTVGEGSVGLEQCVCSPANYRVHPTTASDCVGCFTGNELLGEGVKCPINSTLSTVIVREGFWRHSELSTKLDQCIYSWSTPAQAQAPH